MRVMFVLYTLIVVAYSSCIEDIVRMETTELDLIMVIGLEKSYTNRSVFSFNYRKGRLQEFFEVVRKIDMYTGYISQSEVHRVFTKLRGMLAWNPRGRFVFEYSGDVVFFFLNALKYFVHDVLLIVDGLLFTYIPYQDGNIYGSDLKVIFKGLCSNFKGFQYAPPRVWSNTVLKSVFTEAPPFVIVEEQAFSGVDVELLRDVMLPAVNVSITFNRGITWGSRYSNGLYTDGLYHIKYHKVDVALGFYHVKAKESFYELDVTYPHLIDEVHWFVYSSKEMPYWSNIFYVFNQVLWTTSLTVLLFLGVSWACISRLESNAYKSKWLTTFLPMLTILGQVPSSRPASKPGQILFVCTWFLALLLSNAWNAQLITYLTYPRYEHQISTFEEALEKLYFNVIDETINIYELEDPIIAQKIRSKNIFSTHIYDKEDYAQVQHKKFFEYCLPTLFTFPNGRKGLYVLDEVVVREYAIFPFPIGHPLFKPVNEKILYCLSGGLVLKIEDGIKHKVSLKALPANPAMFEQNVFEWKHVQGAFYMAFIGYVVATFAFCFEYLWSNQGIYSHFCKKLRR